MIQAWLFGVGILFVLAELGIWLKQFILPLPIYILAGAFLAIASNYEKGIIALFRQPDVVEAQMLNVENLRTQVTPDSQFGDRLTATPNREALNSSQEIVMLREVSEENSPEK